MATQTSEVDAVIAALRTVLKEAEGRANQFSWQPKIVNRWIGQLPGAWRGRWRRLYLHAGAGDTVDRSDFIGHVRAALAYLEAQREALGKRRRGWRFSRASKRPVAGPGHAAARIAPSHPEPQPGEDDDEGHPRPKWLN